MHLPTQLTSLHKIRLLSYIPLCINHSFYHFYHLQHQHIRFHFQHTPQSYHPYFRMLQYHNHPHLLPHLSNLQPLHYLTYNPPTTSTSHTLLHPRPTVYIPQQHFQRLASTTLQSVLHINSFLFPYTSTYISSHDSYRTFIRQLHPPFCVSKYFHLQSNSRQQLTVTFDISTSIFMFDLSIFLRLQSTSYSTTLCNPHNYVYNFYNPLTTPSTHKLPMYIQR